MSGQFELWFSNQSERTGQACVFLDPKDMGIVDSRVETLAWLVSGANPSVWVKFVWTVDYGFFWADPGPPETFQKMAADLATANVIDLSHNQNGYFFSNLRGGGPAGTLTTLLDSTVPPTNQLTIGATLGGSPPFGFTGLGPNLQLSVTPAPTPQLLYKVFFGEGIEAGQVLDVAAVVSFASVNFPAGITAMTVTLNGDGTWTVETGVPSLATGAEVVTLQAGKPSGTV